VTGVEPPEWFQRVLDAYERDGADAAWTVLVAAREHDTRQTQAIALIERIRDRDFDPLMAFTQQDAVAALRLLQGGEWPMPKPPPYPADDEGEA
jgi:hypothetical protein